MGYRPHAARLDPGAKIHIQAPKPADRLHLFLQGPLIDEEEISISVGGIALAALAGGAQAQTADHQHHHPAGAKHQALTDSASDCVKTGEACINHYLDLLSQGDREVAACAKSVNELLAVCSTLQRLATVDSKFLVKYAKLAGEVCEACALTRPDHILVFGLVCISLRRRRTLSCGLFGALIVFNRQFQGVPLSRERLFLWPGAEV